MKRAILFLILILLFTSCNAQEKNDLNIDEQKKNEPQTKIIVNKEYDENGNLVSFDSTYSYYYSNIQSDSTLSDSLFDNFHEGFFNSFPDMQKPFLNNLFFEDSLLTYDFYKNDFFSNRFRLNRDKFDNLFEKMDSLKNKFFRKNMLKRKEEKKTKDN